MRNARWIFGLVFYLPLLQAKELGIKELVNLPFAQVYNMQVQTENKPAVKSLPQKTVKQSKSKPAKKLKPVQK